ncbi:unnamed protein product [Sphagnum troendelagicum]
MIWPDEASRGHANLCCAKGRSCNCEALFPIPPPQPLRDLLSSKPAPGARVPPATAMVTETVTLKITTHETSGCGLGVGGYGGLVMPTVLMTLCILSCSTHTESPAGTQILLALPLRLWMG